MNKDYAIKWVKTPRSCAKDCEFYDQKRRVCSCEHPKKGEKKRRCPFIGRR